MPDYDPNRSTCAVFAQLSTESGRLFVRVYLAVSTKRFRAPVAERHCQLLF